MSPCAWLVTHLTQQQVDDVEDHVERELGCEEREEPLGGVHVRLQPHVQEVSVQIWDVFLLEAHRGEGNKVKDDRVLTWALN